MKKAVSMMAIAFLVAATFGCKKKQPEDVARAGFVNFVNGQVMIVSDKGAENPAKVGDKVSQGMKIKTVGDKSFVDVYFGENAVKVLGNTTVEVSALVTSVKTNGEKTEFMVEKGRMFCKITKKLAKDDSFSVKTPTAVAGVRGTNFLVKSDEKKTNVACVEGLLEVLNKSMPNSDPVVVDKEKEVDVLPDQKMAVRDLSDENKKMIRDILSEISDLRKDIWEQMERQREEIKKHVEEQRARDKEMVQQQKDQDKQNVEDQKARDRAMIGEIKGETDAKRSEAISAAKDKMDAAKNVDLGGAKPAIEKQKIDKSGFKPDMNVKPQQ